MPKFHDSAFWLSASLGGRRVIEILKESILVFLGEGNKSQTEVLTVGPTDLRRLDGNRRLPINDIEPERQIVSFLNRSLTRDQAAIRRDVVNHAAPFSVPGEPDGQLHDEPWGLAYDHVSIFRVESMP